MIDSTQNTRAPIPILHTRTFGQLIVHRRRPRAALHTHRRTSRRSKTTDPGRPEPNRSTIPMAARRKHRSSTDAGAAQHWNCPTSPALLSRPRRVARRQQQQIWKSSERRLRLRCDRCARRWRFDRTGIRTGAMNGGSLTAASSEPSTIQHRHRTLRSLSQRSESPDPVGLYPTPSIYLDGWRTARHFLTVFCKRTRSPSQEGPIQPQTPVASMIQTTYRRAVCPVPRAVWIVDQKVCLPMGSFVVSACRGASGYKELVCPFLWYAVTAQLTNYRIDGVLVYIFAQHLGAVGHDEGANAQRGEGR